MARGVFFTVRGSRRFKRRKSKRGKFIYFLAAAVLLTVLALRLPAEQVVQAVAQPGSQSIRFTLIGDGTYLRILSHVIPGLREAVPPVEKEEETSRIDYVIPPGVALPDPRDPKTIISSQIPYLGQAGLQVEPIINKTDFAPQQDEEPRIIIPVRNTPGAGKVIIYHTHTTESFVPTSGRKFTDDLSLTVAQLGYELSELLQSKYQIPVLHNAKIHDIPRNTAYAAALPTVQGLLAENPDAKLVIDLHRDGVDRKVTTANFNGQQAGRILFIVGSRHPQWQENYAKALYLHNILEDLAPGISRGVRERPLVYNQHLHPGCLLIELGGHENSLDEARRTLPILAEALARLYAAVR